MTYATMFNKRMDLQLARINHDKRSRTSRQMVKFVDKMSCGERLPKEKMLFSTIKATKCMKKTKRRQNDMPIVGHFLRNDIK
jgi:hypothetical protein